MWSPTCPYCVQYKPIFEDVAAQAPSGVFMATVDLNEAPQTLAKYGISGIPVTIFLANGKEVHREQGNLSKEDLQRAIAQAFGGAVPAAQTPGQAIIPRGVPMSAPSSFPWGAVGGLAALGLVGYFVLR